MQKLPKQHMSSQNIKNNSKVGVRVKNQKQWKEETICRTCGEEKLVHMLDLGTMPPANAFLEKADLEKEEA